MPNTNRRIRFLKNTTSDNITGGLKAIPTFADVNLANLEASKLIEGNLLYITGTDKYYKLTDLANYNITAGWENFTGVSLGAPGEIPYVNGTIDDFSYGNLSFDGSVLDVTGGISLSDSLIFANGGTQNVRLFRQQNDLVIQGQLATTNFILELAAEGNDGLDDVAIEIDAVGLQGQANREDLWIGWNSTSNQFEIRAEAGGSGTSRNLSLSTQGNTDQLVLLTTGIVQTSSAHTVGISADDDVLTKGYADANYGGFSQGALGVLNYSNGAGGWTASTLSVSGSEISTSSGGITLDPSNGNVIIKGPAASDANLYWSQNGNTKANIFWDNSPVGFVLDVSLASESNVPIRLLPKGTGTVSTSSSHTTNISADNDIITKKYFDDNLSAIFPYIVDDASTNTSIEIAEFRRTTSGAPTNGIGGYITIGVESTAGTVNAARFDSILTRLDGGLEGSVTRLHGLAGGTITQVLAVNASSTSFGNYGFHSIAIGQDAIASGTDAIAIGGGTDATSTESIAMGRNAQSTSNRTIAIGDSSNATFGDAIAIGPSSLATATSTIAIGLGAEAEAIDNIAIGTDAGDTSSLTKGGGAITIGANSNSGASAIGSNSVTVGPNSTNSGIASALLGPANTISANNAVAAGQQANVSGLGGIAIGNNVTASVQGASILGYHTTTQTNSTEDSFMLAWDGNTALHVIGGASKVNYLQIDSAITANSPVISAVGSDTDIDLTLTPKGAGELVINNNVVLNDAPPSATSDNPVLTRNAATGLIELSNSSGRVNAGILAPNGSAAEPSIAFENDSDTGFFYDGTTGTILTSANGVSKVFFGPTGITFSAVVGGPTIFLPSDPQTTDGALRFDNAANGLVEIRNGGVWEPLNNPQWTSFTPVKRADVNIPAHTIDYAYYKQNFDGIMEFIIAGTLDPSASGAISITFDLPNSATLSASHYMIGLAHGAGNIRNGFVNNAGVSTRFQITFLENTETNPQDFFIRASFDNTSF